MLENPPINGFTINNEAVAFEPVFIGIASAFFCSFASAFASCCGCLVSFAEVESAKYSLDLEIASCIITAKMGVKIARASISPAPAPSLSLVPNIAKYRAKTDK